MRTREFVDQTCPKCGCVAAEMKYRRSNLDTGKGEALECKCNRCGYRWEQAPPASTAKSTEHGGSV